MLESDGDGGNAATMSGDSTQIHETSFCARVAEWTNLFLADTDSPFAFADIEGYGAGAMRRTRKDLRLSDRISGGLALTGEVRMPGAREDDPYGPMADDASRKASNAGVRYFFTWNVNTFVLWDHSRYTAPLLERRVREWPLGRQLRNSAEVGRTENLDYIRTKFLPKLLFDLGRIYQGQQPDWAMAPADIFIRSL